MSTTFQQDQPPVKLFDMMQRVVAHIRQRGHLPGDPVDFGQEAEQLCHRAEQQKTAQRLQVAVVGAIKSGKSTFINALLGQDHLRRGAGVVTAMVTRVQRGHPLRASLEFKSWAEINHELNAAQGLLSQMTAGENQPLDIRNPSHRQQLQAVLTSLAPETWIQDGRLNAGSLLLAAYLKGYPEVQAFVREHHATHEFSGAYFSAHQDFVGRDSLAVYLKDVRLFVELPEILEGVEIADCQGSDAPNPRHLAMIQDYLLQAHLLIYVISSRTGLRQADIRFLAMLRTMGILAQTLFVVNCDLNEHASQADLQRVLDRIHTELKVFQPSADIFSFSALYRLWLQTADRLEAREARQLAQWEHEPALIQFCTAQFDAFQQALRQKLTRERNQLLIANPLERLALLLARQNHANQLCADLAGRTRADTTAIIQRMQVEQQKLTHLQELLQNSISGALGPLKQDLRQATDRFFDARSGTPALLTGDLIQQYQLPPLRPGPEISAHGFRVALYGVYQDFRDALDRCMTETVNPEIVRFIREQEKHIQTHLEPLARSYQLMLHEALETYHHQLKALGIPVDGIMEQTLQTPSRERLKVRAALNVPAMQTLLNYSATIKAQSWLRLGWYRLTGWMQRLFKRRGRDSAAEQYRALQDALTQMKAACKQAITRQLMDVRENIKFQYLFKLADVAGAMLLEDTQHVLEMYHSNLTGLAELAESQTVDREALIRRLTDISRQGKLLQTDIAELRSLSIQNY